LEIDPVRKALGIFWKLYFSGKTFFMETANMTTFFKILVIIAALSIFIAYVVLFVLSYKDDPMSLSYLQKTCVAQTKTCPDGSIVKRTGSTCEFAPCPQPFGTTPNGALEIQARGIVACDTKGVFAPKQKVHILGGDFKPGSALSVEMKADEHRFGASFGQTVADENGNIDALLEIPDNTPVNKGKVSFSVCGVGTNDIERCDTGEFKVVASLTMDVNANDIPDVCEDETKENITGSEKER
jgi:hypothetical protein